MSSIPQDFDWVAEYLDDYDGDTARLHDAAKYLCAELKQAKTDIVALQEALRTVVEASDAFDRAVHVHLNVSEDADMPGLDVAVTNYKAAIEKARGLL